MKLPDPELALVGELVARGEVVACAELVGRAEAVAVTEGSAAAERVCVGVGDDGGASVSADVGDPPGVAARAAAEPPEAGADTTPDGVVDPLAAHAVRPAPPMTAAMITAGTRHIPMLPTLR